MNKKKDMKFKGGIYYFHSEFKEIPAEEAKSDIENVKGTIIKGYASTPTLDRYNDIVEPEAFRKSIQTNYAKNPIILFQHMSDKPIGKATFMSIDGRGLYIEALIVDDDIEPKIKAGILKTFSIGYIPQRVEFRDEDNEVLNPELDSDRRRIWNEVGVKRIIKELDLVENSIVSIPANPDALFEMGKSVKSFFDDYVKNNLLNKNIMNKKNLLEKKEDEVIEPEKPVEKVEEKPAEEKPAEEKPAEETIKENDDNIKVDETSDKKEDEKVPVAEEVLPPEKIEEEKPEEKPKEEIPEGEDKALLQNIMTLKGAIVALNAIKALQEKVEELEKTIKETPAKQALSYFEVSAVNQKGTQNKEEVKTPNQRGGFRASLMSAAK